MAMSHLGKSVGFWTAALMLHDIYGALGGMKKRIELVEGLESAKYRDSGQEAKDAMAASLKMAEVDENDVDILESEVTEVEATTEVKEDTSEE